MPTLPLQSHRMLNIDTFYFAPPCQTWVILCQSHIPPLSRVRPCTYSMHQIILFFYRISTSTAKTKYRKFKTNIPSKGILRPQSEFPLHVSVSDLYIPTISLPILVQENMWTDPESILYINRSQTHKYGNTYMRFSLQ